MTLEPREAPAVESYSTFWDDPPHPSTALPGAQEDPYTTFVNLTEDEFPDDTPQDPE